MLQYSYKNISLNHVYCYVIGEDAAKEDISKYLDATSRSAKMKDELLLFVVKDDTAQNVIDKANTGYALFYENLEAVVDNLPLNSYVAPVSQGVFAAFLLSPYANGYLPYIKLTEASNVYVNITDQEPSISLDGYAIFKDSKLCDYISGSLARGFTFLNDEVKITDILVNYKEGKVLMEIFKSKTKIKVETKGKYKFIISIDASSNITNISGNIKIFNKKDIDALNKAQEKVIKEEVESIIEYAKAQNNDILCFRFFAQHEDANIWEQRKDSWKDFSTAFDYEVKVNCNIERGYMIKDPLYKPSGW